MLDGPLVPVTSGVRRAVQILALAVIVLAPMLGIWGVSLDSHWDPAELSRRYGVLAAPTTELLRGTFGLPPVWLPGALVGGTWSIAILGLELVDPLAIAVLGFGGQVPPASMVFGAVLVLGVHVALGRFFCGWLCPYGILSRLVDRVRAPLVRRGWVHSWHAPRWLRFVLLGAVAVAPLVGLSLVSWLLPYLAVPRMVHGLVFGGALPIAGLVTGFLLADLLLGRHIVCRGICPSGALQSLFGRYRRVRLVPQKGVACTRGCTACDTSCWLGIDPRKAFVDPDCDGCGRCMPVCEKTRLVVRIQGPIKRKGSLAILTLLLAGCAVAPAAEKSPDPWSSPFAAPQEPEREAEVAFVEATHQDIAVGAGLAWRPDGLVALRFHVEEEPGTPYRGPIEATFSTSAGELPLSFDKPLWPRGTPKPSLYEQHLSFQGRATLRFDSGPAQGLTLKLPHRADSPWFAALPGAVVLGLWLLAFLLPERSGTGVASPSQRGDSL
jgi:ferredoxin-type protein NapH